MIHRVHTIGHSAEVVLQTETDELLAGTTADDWYDTVLDQYEEQMDWTGVPVEVVDVQGGADQILVEVVVNPYFPHTLDLVVERHVATLHRIKEWRVHRF